MTTRGTNKFTIEGADEIQKVLTQLPLEFQKRALENAFKAGAEVIASEVRKNIKSQGIGNGNISRAFNFAGSQKKNKSRTRVGMNYADDVVIRKPTKEQKRGMNPVSRDTVYVVAMKRPRSRIAHILEFGTAPRQRKNGGFTGQVKPRPFLRPALDTKGREAVDVILKIMRLNIETIASQLAAGSRVRLTRNR